MLEDSSSSQDTHKTSCCTSNTIKKIVRLHEVLDIEHLLARKTFLREKILRNFRKTSLCQVDIVKRDLCVFLFASDTFFSTYED